MAKVIVLIFMLVLVPTIQSWASAPLEPKDPESIRVYNLGLQLCTDHRATDALQIAYASGKEALFNIRILALSSELDKLIDNFWFHWALEQCYPGDTKHKLVLIGSLISADIAGKAVGGIGLAYIYRRVSAVLSILKKHSTAGYYAVNAGFLMPIVYGTYKQFRQFKLSYEKFLADHPEYKSALDSHRAGAISKSQIGEKYIENVQQNLDQKLDQLNLLLHDEFQRKQSQLQDRLAHASTSQEREQAAKALADLAELMIKLGIS
jgi:hypothetical protein